MLYPLEPVYPICPEDIWTPLPRVDVPLLEEERSSTIFPVILWAYTPSATMYPCPSSSTKEIGFPPAKAYRIQGELHVRQGAVVHIPRQEAVEPRIVVPEAHVHLAGVGIPALAVEPVDVVRVVRVVVRIPRVVLPGGGLLVQLPVGGVAVGGDGGAVFVGQSLHVGMGVVAIEALFRT